jgi:hypothetical protein
LDNEKLIEPVTVGAIFEPPAKVKPAWFIWNGRKIRVVRTNHTWSEREGIATLYHYSVTDGTDTFHLVMNSDAQSWHLEGVQLHQ